MAKKLVDNFAGSKWVGPTAKLTPTDLAKSPEDFEKLYDKRHASPRPSAEPRPKLKEIENISLQDRLSEYGLGES